MKKNYVLLSSLALCGAFGIAAAADVAELDIIIRDFPVTHPDFENFQEEASVNFNGTWTYGGFADDVNWQTKRQNNSTWGCGNEKNTGLGIQIGTDGWPISVNPIAAPTFANTGSQLPIYLQTKLSASTVTYYGEWTCSGKKWRGYHHEAPAGCSNDWEQPVYVTPGMVHQYLSFDVALGDDMMYEPKILKVRDACDNQKFEEWFAGDGARTNTTLQLPKVVGTTNMYEVDYNWNNGGYFPLDEIDANNNWIGPKQVMHWNADGSSYTEAAAGYGAQSLSIFCPPYQYEWAATQADYMGSNTAGLCNAWLANGGPRNPNAAVVAAQSNAIGLRHLRNYGFTMMGYAKFKYKKGGAEVFEFAGDDDMWIYVDGVLAVDLGGTHLAAPGKADMDFLSANGHGCHEGMPLAGNTAAGENCDRDVDGSWKDGTWHHLHFFYADRQTDGSNMRIKSSLSELAPSRYGQPVIGDATITPENGEWVVSLILNTGLSEQTVASMQASAAAGGTDGSTAVIVRRPITDGDGNITGYQTFVYGMTSFEFGADKGNEGVVYKMSGALYAVDPVTGAINYAEPQLPQSGDEFSFNYPITDPTVEGYIPGITDSPWILANPITSASGLSTTGPTWSGSQLKASISDNFQVVDNTIDRPSFNVDAMLQNIGKSAGDELPKSATGEILISVLPPAAGAALNGVDGWMKDASTEAGKTNQQLYGSAFESVPGAGPIDVSGMSHGTGDAADVMWIKNKAGNTNAYCYAQNGVESCASISFWTSRPFQVNVRVFDHLGHFISQYTESVSEKEMRDLANAQAGIVGSGSCASKPTFSGVLASVKLYPISQNGRKIASGPYIYQVALIKESWDVSEVADKKPYCFQYAGASSPIGEEAYARSSFSKTLGYRRIGK